MLHSTACCCRSSLSLSHYPVSYLALQAGTVNAAPQQLQSGGSGTSATGSSSERVPVQVYGLPLTVDTPLVDYTSTPFGQALGAAVNTTQLMPSGGQLGFALGHLYPCVPGNAFQTALLRGADAAVRAAAIQLGLRAKFEPVWRAGSGRYCMKQSRYPGETWYTCEECDCPKCCVTAPSAA